MDIILYVVEFEGNGIAVADKNEMIWRGKNMTLLEWEEWFKQELSESTDAVIEMYYEWFRLVCNRVISLSEA